MAAEHDHIDKTLDKLVASTRSPRGRYSASESWKVLEKRISPPARKFRFYRLAGAVAASVLLCLGGWFGYDHLRPVSMQTASAGAGISVVTLPDRTKVTLNRYSSLTYPDRFKGEKREVRLQGEAYFEVEKDAGRPFIVKAEPVDVQVLGTHFNVEAYPGDADVKTTLLEGSVAVSVPETGSRIVLSPGESAVYNRESRTLQEIEPEENDITVDWRDGHFRFDYLPLQEIVRELSNAFQVKIRITDEAIKNFRIRAHFTEGESLDQMLDLLQSAGNFSYTKTNDTILIRSKLN
ncbi:FecR domain-containing protein [Parabacteroides sp. AF17-28]|uniref:FecR family protein n=1 Tax=Parabacteroides sp. AF17-28 TaxID=2292241 RepID=UPI000F005799|nr:FecR domain-containing protein [Parabacteroides sp. AF17-28]RHR61696.1 DUF4974 domain-containing protein [Parabacteroides sp. AF17-28]